MINKIKKTFNIIIFIIWIFIFWIANAYQNQWFTKYSENNWNIEFECNKECAIIASNPKWEYIEINWIINWNWMISYWLIWKNWDENYSNRNTMN